MKRAVPRWMTLWEPWASLVASGAKQFETRPTKFKFRGEFFIHAASQRTYRPTKELIEGLQALWPNVPVGEIIRESMQLDSLRDIWTVKQLPSCGKILCRTQLVSGVKTEEIVDRLSDQEQAFGNYESDRWAYGLDKITRLPQPIAQRGFQGMRTVSPELYAEIQAQFEE